ncbi:MAG TPA: FliA/WhiG family RNA polymerase sigma factor [Bryobacteraceae bacterium]|jgi:RNA polymerase sigma factor for flagellar operon FliA
MTTRRTNEWAATAARRAVGDLRTISTANDIYRDAGIPSSHDRKHEGAEEKTTQCRILQGLAEAWISLPEVEPDLDDVSEIRAVLFAAVEQHCADALCEIYRGISEALLDSQETDRCEDERNTEIVGSSEKVRSVLRKGAAASWTGPTPNSAQAPRLASRDRVVLNHLPLVEAIAVRIHENLPMHVELDDLVHAGILGLFDAATKYNPEKQVVFSSYAKHRIKGAIFDSLRQLNWASLDTRRRHKQVEAVARDLSSTLHRDPTEAEVAAKLGVDLDRWRAMMLDARDIRLVFASTCSNENEDLPPPDFPGKREAQPDSICSREQLRGVLSDAMKTLPERHQKVVLLYYTNEMTMKEIGGVLGISEKYVSQIHKAALEKMMAVLQANGIRSSQAF